MNRTIINTLSILATLAVVTPAALATEIAAKPEVLPVRAALTPNQLVNEAYNGRIEGIPGYITFRNEALRGDIEAEDLVAAAIAEGRLTTVQLEDGGYLNAVTANLRRVQNRN